MSCLLWCHVLHASSHKRRWTNSSGFMFSWTLHAITKILPSSSATRNMSRRWKESTINVWEKWAWTLLTPSFFNIRRNGTNSQRGLQKNSLNDCPEAWQDIQRDPPLDQIQTELFTPALSNYVPNIQHSPTCNIPRHNGPSLLWRPGPQWTEPTKILTPCIYSLYFHLIDGISISIRKIYMVKIRAGWDLIKLWTFHELIREELIKFPNVVIINFYHGKNQFPP